VTCVKSALAQGEAYFTTLRLTSMAGLSNATSATGATRQKMILTPTKSGTRALNTLAIFAPKNLASNNT